MNHQYEASRKDVIRDMNKLGFSLRTVWRQFLCWLLDHKRELSEWSYGGGPNVSLHCARCQKVCWTIPFEEHPSAAYTIRDMGLTPGDIHGDQSAANIAG